MSFLWRLLQCFAVWRMKMDKRSVFPEAQVLIGYGFGDYGNRAMASLIRELAHRDPYPIPLALQWDIAQYLPDTGKFIVVECHRESGIDGKPLYLDTEEVTAQVANKCLPLGLRKAIIVAHPDHCRRCVWNAQAHGFEVIGVLDTSSVPYGPVTNWASKSRFRFTIREILARLFYLRRGWI